MAGLIPERENYVASVIQRVDQAVVGPWVQLVFIVPGGCLFYRLGISWQGMRLQPESPGPDSQDGVGTL